MQNTLLGCIVLVLSLATTALNANFDWGSGNGECSGEGSFAQQITFYDTVEVGQIPKDKQDIYIQLSSEEDVDIQIYDAASGTAIVGWGIGAYIGQYPNTNLQYDYAGVHIEYSGYNGDGSGVGHEFIRLSGTLDRDLTMKAFGYHSGYATVAYSWKGTKDCEENSGPAESGSGTFKQQIAENAIVKVGDLVPGLNDVYIELLSDEDVDIQLYDASTKIVHWPYGILNGSGVQSTEYAGMTIEWSGYNGDEKGPGHEYIKISGTLDRTLTMKAYGFQAGYATVNYSWGTEESSSKSDVVRVDKVPFFSQLTATCKPNYLCGYAGTTMLTSFYHDYTPTTSLMQDMAEYITSKRCPSLTSDSEDYAKAAQEIGNVPGAYRAWISWDDLKQFLKDGTPVLVSVKYASLGTYRCDKNWYAGHSVVVTGVSELKGEWYIHDPLCSTASLGSYKAIPSGTFRSAVKDITGDDIDALIVK